MSPWLIVLLCVVYLVGWAIATRLLIRADSLGTYNVIDRGIMAFFATPWPAFAALAIIFLPFLGMGWLAARVGGSDER